MKIAAIHNFLTEKRGANFAFLNMVLHLSKRGHLVDVYVLNISDYFEEKLNKNNVPFCSLNFTKHDSINFKLLAGINVLKIAMLFSKLSKKVNQNYDLAFVHHYLFSPLIMPFLNIPKVYYCHEPPRDVTEPSFQHETNNSSYLFNFNKLKLKITNHFKAKIDKYCAKKADLILTNSHYSKEYIWRTYGIFPKTNYLGVDIKKFKNLNIKKENMILSVGSICTKKGHDFVIKSLGIIPTSKRPKLIIVGTGTNQEKETIKTLAVKNKVNLEIKSNISDEELALLYNKAKIMAIAYIMEPSIEPEALGCETPIIAIKEGGVRETIIDGITGILVDRDELEFAKAIEYLLDNPDIARKMGKEGRRWLQKSFTWEKCVSSLENNFLKAIKPS